MQFLFYSNQITLTLSRDLPMLQENEMYSCVTLLEIHQASLCQQLALEQFTRATSLAAYQQGLATGCAILTVLDIH